jgi:hypothetical protein
MRARSVLRAVALLTTLAGLLAVPTPSLAASSSKSKSTAKSTKKPASKSTASKKSTPAKSTKPAATASKSAPASASKAAYDPVATGTSIPAAPAATAAAGAPPQRGPTRIDFDDRLIQGQTNKSGAVYLYDRKELKQRSMIKKRETFREEIVGAVYDSEL